MGFDLQEASRSLQQTDNNVEEALKYLLGEKSVGKTQVIDVESFQDLSELIDLGLSQVEAENAIEMFGTAAVAKENLRDLIAEKSANKSDTVSEKILESLWTRDKKEQGNDDVIFSV